MVMCAVKLPNRCNCNSLFNKKMCHLITGTNHNTAVEEPNTAVPQMTT